MIIVIDAMPRRHVRNKGVQCTPYNWQRRIEIMVIFRYYRALIIFRNVM